MEAAVSGFFSSLISRSFLLYLFDMYIIYYYIHFCKKNFLCLRVCREDSVLFQSTGINPDTTDISRPLKIIHLWYLLGTDFCRTRILTSAGSIQTVHISFLGCGLPSCQWGIPPAFRPPLPLNICLIHPTAYRGGGILI